jgi:hypothetical protein
MSRKCKLILITLLTLQFSIVTCNFFTVVGSGTLRINESYKAAVTSHTIDDILELKVSVTGTNINGESVEISQQVQVSPQTTKFLRFKTGNFTLGSYKLRVEGLNLTKEVAIHLNPQKVSLMIQTNKPIYKTQDSVDFRVFAINSRTKPYVAKSYSNVFIFDSRHHELRRWKNVQFKMGVFEGKFKFSDLDAGIYEILAEVDGSVTTKTFEIVQDIRRLFEVELMIPKLVSYREGQVNYDLVITPIERSSSSIIGHLIISSKHRNFIQTIRINKSRFSDLIDFRNDLKLMELENDKQIDIQATFIDERTLKNFTTHTSFVITMSSYKVDIVNAQKFFKPKIPFVFTIVVSNLDGFPLVNSTEKIQVSVIDDDGKFMINDTFQPHPISGSIEFKTPKISNTTASIKIIAKFDKIQYTKAIRKNPLKSREFITINAITPQPKMYEIIEFEIHASNELQQFAVFQLFSKGLLRMSRAIQLTKGYAKFSINPKFSFVPKSHCIVFYVSDGGEIISGRTTVVYDHSFPNYVSNFNF